MSSPFKYIPFICNQRSLRYPILKLASKSPLSLFHQKIWTKIYKTFLIKCWRNFLKCITDTQREFFFKSQSFGLGQTFWAENFWGTFGVLSAILEAVHKLCRLSMGERGVKNCRFYTVKRQLRGGKGVKNRQFWDNMVYGLPPISTRFGKVRIFWETHKIWKNLYLVNFQSMRKIAQVFVCFSESLNFTVSPFFIFSIIQPLFLQKTKPLYPHPKYSFGIGI